MNAFNRRVLATLPHPEKSKPLIATLRIGQMERIPFWFMRQAGRYLPEYRQVRAQAGGFLELCLNPELATEVTLQPIQRFGMDAAILFSDILVVPHALGMAVSFEEGEGPKLDPLPSLAHLPRFERDGFLMRLQPVYETVDRIRERLPEETTLIGFAGAPWTVATYMIEGGSSRDFARSKSWAYVDSEGFDRLIELLVEATTEHLSAQITAGAEVVQLFDSWAGALAEPAFLRWVIEPTCAISTALKKRHPDVSLIGFPRGAGAGYASFAAGAGVDALSLDTTVPLGWAARELQTRLVVQGNLDPQLLVVGGQAMLDDAMRIVSALGAGPFIFNLGHGIVPETPPEHVEQLSAFLRALRR